MYYIFLLILSLWMTPFSRGFCQKMEQQSEEQMAPHRFNGKKLVLSEKKWKEQLSSKQFGLLREHRTEPAFHNAYCDCKKEGMYHCAGCDLALFSSAAKYDSGTGWPSFWQPICEENISYRLDETLPRVRTEVHCSRCEGHLGHVFNDGPLPTGKRYCINSGSLTFVPLE